MSIPEHATRADLRRHFRAARNELDPAAITAASALVTRAVLGLPEASTARRFAAYLADDGEIDAGPLIEEWWAAGREVYLPIVVDRSPLLFARYRAETTLAPNRLGILEPPADEVVAATRLDIVVTPLVAFDRRCHRLGRGGGYYDRTFAHRRDPAELRPRLVGVAHECQRAEDLPVASHDVPLDIVVTERTVHRASTPDPNG